MSYWLLAMVLLSDVGLNCGCGFCGGEHIAWWLMALAQCSDLRVAWLLQWLQNTPSSRGWWLYIGLYNPINPISWGSSLPLRESVWIWFSYLYITKTHQPTQLGKASHPKDQAGTKASSRGRCSIAGGHQMPWDGWLATIKAGQKLGIFGWT